MNWHILGIPTVFELLGTTKTGLNSEIAMERLQKDGPNELESAKKFSNVRIFFEQFKDLMIIILLCSALISVLILNLSMPLLYW